MGKILEKKRVIGITGANGMMGASLISRLLLADDLVQLRCLVRHPQLRKRHDRVEYLAGDLLAAADCEDFVQGLDAVVHLAQSSTPATSDRHWPSDLAGNMMLSVQLFEAIRQRGAPCHIVYASSGGAIYGHHPKVSLYHEELPCFPMSPYGIQKLAAEHYLRLGVAQGWLSACALRISNAYGVALPAERRQGLIGVAVARHQKNEAIDLFGSAETVRDFIHIEDVSAAIVQALDYQNGFSAINISSGQGHSVRQILDLLEEVSGVIVKLKASAFGEKQFAMTPRIVLDNSKAAKLLHWAPEVPLRMGIERMWREASSI